MGSAHQRHVELLHHPVDRGVLLGEAGEEVARLVLERVDEAVDARAAAVFGEILLDLDVVVLNCRVTRVVG